MKFNFCPNCGTRLRKAEDAHTPQICSNCGRTHYYNSKPCAGALVVKDGRVLLVKRVVEPFKGCWDIPGGFLEAGEHPLDGMLREVREETGLEVRVRELLGVYVDRYPSDDEDVFTLNHYYVVERGADCARPTMWTSGGGFRSTNCPQQMKSRSSTRVSSYATCATGCSR